MHFAPRNHWVNDPNGLVHHEGRWHLFFQHNPNGDHWADMSWGHAVSTNLATWDERPVAIRPEVDATGRATEHIFSGSAVHDGDDLVAIYTSVDLSAGPDGPQLQRQCLARSTDGGETWLKDPANPVLDRGSSDFRDPKVFRDADRDRWVMVAVEAVDRLVVVYESTDLHAWTLLSEFADPALESGPWECPDLFPLRVEGTDVVRWVLLVSVISGAPGGGSGMRWWVGDFDGSAFKPEHSDWLDQGRDCYAGVTWNDAPDGRRVLIGWLSNWAYARDTPSTGWRGAMTLPRDLTLVHSDAGPRLRQTVSPELASYEHLEVVLRPGAPDGDELVLHEGSIRIRYDDQAAELVVERAAADFSGSFAAVSRAAVPVVDGGVTVEVWVDACSVELFADGGLLALSFLSFPRTSG
jgi:sucrose-6-phosphate hydrolase SacC (GH32 family)